MNWLSQIASVTWFGLCTIPKRKGSSITAICGIAGVVVVFVGVLSIAQGFRRAVTSTGRDDGLELDGAFVTAVNRCAPPANRPTPAERDNCLPYLAEELSLLSRARALLALGSYAWAGALLALAALGHPAPRPRPRFGHEAEARIGPYLLVGSFHPSQQNTFTGKLTVAMLDRAIARAARG